MKNFNPNTYIKDNYRQFLVKIDKEKYPHIIQKLEDVVNITAYVRDLVNEDLRNGEKTKQI